MISIPRLRPVVARTLPLLGIVLVGCGSTSATSSHATPTPAAGASTAASANVGISAYKFVPSTISVKRGGSVTFSNRDPTAHTATADTGSSFDTGTLQQGQSKKVTFETSGTFPYHCVFHAFMTGSVIVS